MFQFLKLRESGKPVSSLYYLLAIRCTEDGQYLRSAANHFPHTGVRRAAG